MLRDCPGHTVAVFAGASSGLLEAIPLPWQRASAVRSDGLRTGMFFSDAKASLAEITAASRPWCPADTGTQGPKPLSPRRGTRNDPDQHSTRGGPDGAARDRSR